MAEIDVSRMHLRFMMFVDQIEPKGRLVIDRACHACWWYAILASKNLNMVGVGPESQVIVEEDGLQSPLWMKLNFDQIARSVAMTYGLESPDKFLPYRQQVEREAMRLGFKLNEMIWKPFGVGVVRS